MNAESNQFGGHEDFTFGGFGGRYVPETLVQAHEELYAAWQEAWVDPAYHAELRRLRADYVGGPTPLWKCQRLTDAMGMRLVCFSAGLYCGLMMAVQAEPRSG